MTFQHFPLLDETDETDETFIQKSSVAYCSPRYQYKRASCHVTTSSQTTPESSDGVSHVQVSNCCCRFFIPLTSRRKRRVKCDETFPACLRCVRLGQVCDGYGVWGGGGAIKGDTYATPGSTSSESMVAVASTICCDPSSSPRLRVSTEEQSYLEWFIHGTAGTPPRIFNSSFWDPAILQATAQEPMVLQGLLTLSAAHKRHVLDPANRDREGLAPDALEIFLLKHYGNTVKGLQDYLGGDTKIPKAKWSVAAIMCSLLVLIELMRGRFEAACVHLESGAYIARHIAKEPGQLGVSRQITQFFVRLRDQTMIFRHRVPKQRPYSTRLAATPVFDLRFSSPAEAAHYLDDLVEQVAYLTQQSKQMSKMATESRVSFVMHQDTCRYLLSCFESWYNAYNSTLAEQRLSISPSDLLAYEALFQRYTISIDVGERCLGSSNAVEGDQAD
jgi:hypothetical protein